MVNLAVGEGEWTGEFRNFNGSYGPVGAGVFYSPDYSWVGAQGGVSIGPMPASGSYTVTEYHEL